MAKTLASKAQTPWNAYTRLRASRIGLGSCRTVGEWPTPVPLASLSGCYWRGSLRSSGSVVNPLRAFTGLPGQNAGTLFLMGGRPGRSECGRSDGDAARMADDRVLPPLIADKTGAAGTAEQGCQGYAREFCHGWFHNIIPAFRPADGTTAAVLSRITRSADQDQMDGNGLAQESAPPTSAHHGSTVRVSGSRRRGPSTDAAQVPLASAVRSSDTHRR